VSNGTTPRTTRRPARRTALCALLFAGLVMAGCTPEQYQAWWVSRGNPPLSEPELSRAAAAATQYWAEIARRNRFRHGQRPIDAALAARMTPSSWRPGCPVPLSQLRYVQVSHMGFDGRERTAELVVHQDVANAVIIAFKLMWDEGFPIERMRLVDDYGGNDDASMAANNSSAFNCRRVAGSSTWSQHSYGRAIDLNPVQNPYVSGATVSPPAGRSYLDRRAVRPGMIVPNGAAHAAFRAIGWGWGGSWSSSKDYQHFSANGR
jgi:hypothetical protein